MPKFEIKNGKYRIDVEENKEAVYWKIREDATLRAYGNSVNWHVARSDIRKELGNLIKDPFILDRLIFDIQSRPSELQIQEAIGSLEPAPGNELLAYPVAVSYGALGLKGDDTYVRKGADGIYEARMAVEIFGSESQGHPFDDTFRGNFVSGRAATREAALKLMILEAARLAASLW